MLDGAFANYDNIFPDHNLQHLNTSGQFPTVAPFPHATYDETGRLRTKPQPLPPGRTNFPEDTGMLSSSKGPGKIHESSKHGNKGHKNSVSHNVRFADNQFPLQSNKRDKDHLRTQSAQKVGAAEATSFRGGAHLLPWPSHSSSVAQGVPHVPFRKKAANPSEIVSNNPFDSPPSPVDPASTLLAATATLQSLESTAAIYKRGTPSQPAIPNPTKHAFGATGSSPLLTASGAPTAFAQQRSHVPNAPLSTPSGAAAAHLSAGVAMSRDAKQKPASHTRPLPVSHLPLVPASATPVAAAALSIAPSTAASTIAASTAAAPTATYTPASELPQPPRANDVPASTSAVTSTITSVAAPPAALSQRRTSGPALDSALSVTEVLAAHATADHTQLTFSASTNSTSVPSLTSTTALAPMPTDAAAASRNPMRLVPLSDEPEDPFADIVASHPFPASDASNGQTPTGNTKLSTSRLQGPAYDGAVRLHTEIDIEYIDKSQSIPTNTNTNIQGRTRRLSLPLNSLSNVWGQIASGNVLRVDFWKDAWSDIQKSVFQLPLYVPLSLPQTPMHFWNSLDAVKHALLHTLHLQQEIPYYGHIDVRTVARSFRELSTLGLCQRIEFTSRPRSRYCFRVLGGDDLIEQRARQLHLVQNHVRDSLSTGTRGTSGSAGSGSKDSKDAYVLSSYLASRTPTGSLKNWEANRKSRAVLGDREETASHPFGGIDSLQETDSVSRYSHGGLESQSVAGSMFSTPSVAYSAVSGYGAAYSGVYSANSVGNSNYSYAYSQPNGPAGEIPSDTPSAVQDPTTEMVSVLFDDRFLSYKPDPELNTSASLLPGSPSTIASAAVGITPPALLSRLPKREPITCASFSKDGRYFVAGGGPDEAPVLRVWAVRPAPIAQPKQKKGPSNSDSSTSATESIQSSLPRSSKHTSEEPSQSAHSSQSKATPSITSATELWKQSQFDTASTSSAITSTNASVATSIDRSFGAASLPIAGTTATSALAHTTRTPPGTISASASSSAHAPADAGAVRSALETQTVAAYGGLGNQPFPPLVQFGASFLEPLPMHVWTGHNERITALDWSVNSLLLTAARDGEVRLWFPTREECFHKFQHPGKVVGVAFLPAWESLFVTACVDMKIRIWSLETGRVVFLLSVPAPILDMVVFDSGKYIGLALEDGRICLYRTQDLSLAKEAIYIPPKNPKTLFQGFKRGEFVGISACPMDKLLAMTLTTEVCLFSLPDLALQGTYGSFPPHDSPSAAQFDPSGKRFSVATASGRVYVFRVDTSLNSHVLAPSVRPGRFWHGRQKITSCEFFEVSDGLQPYEALEELLYWRDKVPPQTALEKLHARFRGHLDKLGESMAAKPPRVYQADGAYTGSAAFHLRGPSAKRRPFSVLFAPTKAIEVARNRSCNAKSPCLPLKSPEVQKLVHEFIQSARIWHKEWLDCLRDIRILLEPVQVDHKAVPPLAKGDNKSAAGGKKNATIIAEDHQEGLEPDDDNVFTTRPGLQPFLMPQMSSHERRQLRRKYRKFLLHIVSKLPSPRVILDPSTITPFPVFSAFSESLLNAPTDDSATGAQFSCLCPSSEVPNTAQGQEKPPPPSNQDLNANVPARVKGGVPSLDKAESSSRLALSGRELTSTASTHTLLRPMSEISLTQSPRNHEIHDVELDKVERGIGTEPDHAGSENGARDPGHAVVCTHCGQDAENETCEHSESRRESSAYDKSLEGTEGPNHTSGYECKNCGFPRAAPNNADETHSASSHCHAQGDASTYMDSAPELESSHMVLLVIDSDGLMRIYENCAPIDRL